MEKREITSIASGVEGRRRLGDVLPHDCRIADLLVAMSELVMREADGFGIVRLFGVAERPAEQRNRPRLVAFRKSDPPVKTPERGKERGREVIARRVRWTSQRRRRLREVVAHQIRLGERASQANLVLVFESRGFQRLREHADRIDVSAALERGSRARQRRLKGDGDHRRQYTTPFDCAQGKPSTMLGAGTMEAA